MTKTMLVSIGGLALLLALVLACGTLALAVRQGAVSEVMVRFPPGTRFQFILRVGEDSMPWQRSGGREMAINIWAHQQGTDWHIVNLIHVSLGDAEGES